MKSNSLGIRSCGFMIFLLLMLIPTNGFGQTRNITGTIVEEDGNPMPGISIIVKGTMRGAITDFEGNYTIKASSDETLIFSFMGKETQEIPVNDRSIINVTMITDAADIDELVVVGYGVQEKQSVVGAISQISGDKIKSIKMGGSLENSLQGNLPGLTVMMTDATPGEEAESGLRMLIRGSASLVNNDPLVLVDGIERSFSNIDPNEIASISILKDASATAVYGVKGANGVIIITTKRGRSGAAQLEFTSDVSIKSASRLPEYLNAYETLSMRNEAFRNDQRWSKIYSDETLAHYRDQDEPYLYPDFDWMDFLFKPAIDQHYNLNARGGNDFVHYFVSLAYLNEGDIFTTGHMFPFDYDEHNASYFHNRYNFRNNLDFQLSKTTKLSVNLGGNIKHWGKPFDTYTHETWFEPVTLMPVYPEDILDYYPDDRIPYDQDGVRYSCNPDMGNVRLDWMGGRGFDRKKSSELSADVTLKQKLDFITQGLSISGTYSYNNWVRYEENFRTDNQWYGALYGYYLNPETQEWSRYDTDGNLDLDTPQPKLRSFGDNLNGSARSLYYRIQSDYNRTFGDHKVSAIGIFSRRESRGMSDFTHYEENWVGRATYNYKGKYFIEGSIAHSGSEKFAPGLRFGTFPATAVGWLLSEEKFIKENFNWLSIMKIRYSYGKVGSDGGIARWLYRSEYSDAGSVAFGYPYNYYGTIQEGVIPITNATWETAIKNNLGFEFGFLKNMFTLNIDLFKEQRIDILQSRRRVPSWVGAGNIEGNIGETKSHGFELDFSFKKNVTNELYIYATANFSGSESRVVFYDEPVTKPFNLSVEGKPVEIAQRMSWYTPAMGVEVAGYYQNIDELFMAAEASGVNPGLGDHMYLDLNGDGNIDEQDYIVSEHPFAPAYVWNTKLGFNFKGWNGRIDFYGISDVEYQMRQGGMFYLYPFSQNKDNALLAHADYWTPENADASYPAVHSRAEFNPNYRFSSFSNVNGKYFRLKNIRIGYEFDVSHFKALEIHDLEIALSGTNLITITDYPLGGDPEGANSGTDFGAYPQLRRISCELKVVF